MAEAADARAIAELHVNVWPATYTCLASPEALEKLCVGVCLPQWQVKHADPASAAGVLMIRSGIKIVSFAKAQLDSHGPMNGRGEMNHLYVLRSEQSHGLGQLVFKASAS